MYMDSLTRFTLNSLLLLLFGPSPDAAGRVHEWKEIQWNFIREPPPMTKEDNLQFIIIANSSEKKMTVKDILLGSIVAVCVVGAALMLARKVKMQLRRILRMHGYVPTLTDHRELQDEVVVTMSEKQRESTANGAALWEFVRSLLRQYCELKMVSMTVKAPEGYSMEERKLNLREILYKLEMLCDVGPYVLNHIKLNRELLNADEVDIERLRYHLQMLTLATTNAAITRASGGKADSASEPPHVRLLRAVYAKLRHVGTAYVTQDNKVQAWSRTSFIGAVDESKMTLSTTLDNIRSNSEYERDEFVQRRCSEIEEKIQKMGGSAECDGEWIQQVRLLGSQIQLLMLAIVNVELRDGRRSSPNP